jgi:hypothetical protein
MKMNMFFTWCGDEKHLGVEICCDICNDLLERPEIWYYRCVPDDEYPHMAVCTYCAAKMTVEMKRDE